MKQITTPILFMVFNRPEKTQIVFDSIRSVRPTKLYVAIDAPREGRQDDINNCKKVKEIVHQVDWPCEVHYLEHSQNLGCSKAGITAWNWIFKYEDRMIFIEDDGLGNESAFSFVQEMLERYKDDRRIAYVGAVNYGMKYGTNSYFISRLPSATYFMGVWRRTQDLYEYEIESFSKTRWKRSFYQKFQSIYEYIIECSMCEDYLKSIKQGKRLNTYDVQMIYLSYKYDMYSIYPNINMVSNIGLDGGANNHVSKEDPMYKQLAMRPRFELDNISHPVVLECDKEFEKSFYRLRRLYGASPFWKAFTCLFLGWYRRLRKHLSSNPILKKIYDKYIK